MIVLPSARKCLHRLDAALLEIGVADREDLVEQQDVGIEVRRDGEAQPHVHARRVVLDRHVDEVGEPGILDDRIVDALDLRPRQPVDRGVEKQVLASGELRMEADAELDHRRDPGVARDQQAAAGRPVNRGDALQERALARAVAPDQANRFAPSDPQRDILQRPELLDRLAPVAVQQAEEADLQLDRGVVPEQEPFGELLRFDDRHGH